jgi:hypothetical protein
VPLFSHPVSGSLESNTPLIPKLCLEQIILAPNMLQYGSGGAAINAISLASEALHSKVPMPAPTPPLPLPTPHSESKSQKSENENAIKIEIAPP